MATDTSTPSASADDPSTELSTTTAETSGQTVDNVDVSLQFNSLDFIIYKEFQIIVLEF